MDTQVKLWCSLKWLCGILSGSPLMQESNMSRLLLEPYQDDILKRELVCCLTSPSLYLGAYSVLFPSDSVKLLGDSFEPLIHGLAKRGVYVLEEDSTIVTDPMLTQQDPFRERSHLALLDALMSQYSSKIITVQRIIHAVKQISRFNPSKELPSKIEVDLLLKLWLNKVSAAVFSEHQAKVKQLLMEPDLRRRRKNKVLLLQSGVGNNHTIPHIEGDLCSGIKDGRSLATLLLYYAPQDFSMNEFEFSIPMKKKRALKNLQIVYEYFSTHLPPPNFHISPLELMEWAQSGLLTANISALLSHLFYFLEMKGSPGVHSQLSVPKPPIPSRSLHSASEGTIKPSEMATKKAPQFSLRQCLLSCSAGNLLAPIAPKAVEISSPLVRSSCAYAPLRERVSSTPGAVAKPVDTTDSGATSRVFETPFRSSLSENQSKVMASFNKDSFILSKGAQTRSSPLLHPQTPVQKPPLVQNSQLISVSMDNLNSHNPVRVSTREDLVQRGQSPSQRSNTVPLRSTADPSSSTGYGERKPQPDSAFLPPNVRGSFTLDKQHTFASATKAGLPIINGHNKPPPRKVANNLPAKSPGSPSTVKSEVLLVTNSLQQGSQKADLTIPSQPIPASVQALRLNVKSFLLTLDVENANLDMEARLQRLKICHPGNSRVGSASKKPGPTASAHATVPESSASPGVTVNSEAKKATFTIEVTPSLEQFVHDEALIQQQVMSSESSAPEKQDTQGENAPDKHKTSTAPTTRDAPHYPLETLPFSPISNDGQVFIEQTPLLERQSCAEVKSQAGFKNDAEAEPHPNPWVKTLDEEDKLLEKKKREQEIRQKMEERALARKLMAEQRRNRDKHTIGGEYQARQHNNRKKNRKTDVINNHQPHSLDAIPSNTEHHAATVRAGTIHFQLSAHNNPQPPYQQQEDKPVAEEAEEDTGSQAQAPLSPSLSVGAYSGPDCYVKPKGKSNLQIIRNAICAVCLAGTVNMSLKQKTLVEIDKSSATHVVILFRDTVGFKFRGIYSYNSGDRHVLKIYGSGPKEIKESMVSHLYKYNSGQKEFKEIPARSLSASVDGLTIKSEYWHVTRRKAQTDFILL